MAVRDRDTPAGAVAPKAPDAAPAGGTTRPRPDGTDAERVAELERENEALRRMLAQAQGVGTIRLETSEALDRPRRVILSEGVKHDLERLGEVTDPGSGLLLRMDESGTVTAHERGADEPADVEIVGG